MPIKHYHHARSPEYERWPGGFTWIAHPDETMQRASHAVALDADGVPVAEGEPPADAEVLVVEPIDAAGLDDRLAELGSVTGVVVLAELHRRDAAVLANRHGVPVYLPAVIAGLKRRIDAPVEVFEGPLPGTSFRAVPTLEGVPWSESVLYDAPTGTLVATEVLVTSRRATGPGERLAVGPYARLRPPRDALDDLAVERVLVGHGRPLFDDAQPALEHALANARRGLPAYLLGDLVFMLKAGYVAMRD